MKYQSHLRPDDTHDCAVKLAKQRANGDADIFVPLHPDWRPPLASRDTDGPPSGLSVNW